MAVMRMRVGMLMTSSTMQNEELNPEDIYRVYMEEIGGDPAVQ